MLTLISFNAQSFLHFELKIHSSKCKDSSKCKEKDF